MFHGEEILVQVATVILLLFLMAFLLVVKDIFGASVVVAHPYKHHFLMCVLISVERRIGLLVNAPSSLTTRQSLLVMK